MKTLFLIFHGFDKANGISKKIHYQVKALKKCGADVRLCYYDTTPFGNRRLMIGDEVMADFGKAGEDRLCVHPFLSQRQPFHAAAGGTPEKDGGESGGGDTDISLRSGVHLMVYEGFARCGPLFPPPDGKAAGRHRDFLQRGNDFRRQDDPDFQRDRFRRYPDAERTERHFARAAPDRCGGGALLARVRPPGTGPRGVLPDESGI